MELSRKRAGGGSCGARVADRTAKIARDAGPSAALSRDDATTRLASPATPCGQTDLTHDFAVESPVRNPVSHRGECATSPEGSGRLPVNSEGTARSALPNANCLLPTDSWGAPSGYHDDCVIALALANHGRWECGTAGTCARLLLGDPRWGWRPRRRRDSEGRERVCVGV